MSVDVLGLGEIQSGTRYRRIVAACLLRFICCTQVLSVARCK